MPVHHSSETRARCSRPRTAAPDIQRSCLPLRYLRDAARSRRAAFALHSRFDVVWRDRRRWIFFIEHAGRERQPWIFPSMWSKHSGQTAASFSVEAATEVRRHRARVPFSCSRRPRSIPRRQRSRGSITSMRSRANCVPHGDERAGRRVMGVVDLFPEGGGERDPRRSPRFRARPFGPDDGTDLRSFLHHQARRDGNGTLHQPLDRGRPWWPPLGVGEQPTGSRLPVRASGGRVRQPSRRVIHASRCGAPLAGRIRVRLSSSRKSRRAGLGMEVNSSEPKPAAGLKPLLSALQFDVVRRDPSFAYIEPIQKAESPIPRSCGTPQGHRVLSTSETCPYFGPCRRTLRSPLSTTIQRFETPCGA